MKQSRQVVSEFTKCVMAMSQMLEEDGKLDELEKLVIEDHMLVLQLAYINWKRRAKAHNDLGKKLST
jgi:hypothetical protein